jgi:hypothetical protein
VDLVEKHTAVCTRRQFQRASSGTPYNAIIIFLENLSGYSVHWFRVCRRTENGYEFDDLMAHFGKPMVFMNSV